MFQDPSYQVDTESEDFRLLNPVITKKYETLNTQKEDGDSDEVCSVYLLTCCIMPQHQYITHDKSVNLLLYKWMLTTRAHQQNVSENSRQKKKT